MSKKRNIRTFCVYFFTSILVTAALTSAYQLVFFYTNTSKEQEEYDDLRVTQRAEEKIKVVKQAPCPSPTSGGLSDWLLPVVVDYGDPTVPVIAQQTPQASVDAADATAITTQKFAAYTGGMGINFRELYETNEDIAGWMRIDNTPVDYPVVQGKNNEY